MWFISSGISSATVSSDVVPFPFSRLSSFGILPTYMQAFLIPFSVSLPSLIIHVFIF